MTTRIRAAHPSDAAWLAAIHAAAFPVGEVWGESAFASQLALPGVFGFVAPNGGLVLARVAAGEAEILTLAVIPPARRRGMGTALLRAAMAEALARGAEAVFLEVSGGNEPARALYDAAQFRRVGHRPRYYADGSDALVLAAKLSPAAAADG
jgi:ribosomal-protein-alanine N-acetyltransferase